MKAVFVNGYTLKPPINSVLKDSQLFRIVRVGGGCTRSLLEKQSEFSC